ncbi:MAG: class I SAM-dependent methyltransferase [bacterium]|nr:MAG: class I SAM-dependent methyltransferase [bacterium]
MTNINYSKQSALGYAGLALLRNWLIGEDSSTIPIFDEISSLVMKLPNTLEIVDAKTKAVQYDIKSGYKIWSKTYDTEDNILIQVEEPIVKKILKKYLQGKVLDLGCGTGRYSLYLDSLGHSVTGIDISMDMIELARQKSKQIQFVQGDISNLTFEDNNFDLVVSGLAIHYVKNLEKSIDGFSRVLRPGGHMVISSVHPWMVALGAHAEFHNKKSGWGFIKDNVIWHSSYIEAFNKSSLKIIECYEPKIGLKEIKTLQKLSALSSKTMSLALKGLPIAIVWVLEKSK